MAQTATFADDALKTATGHRFYRGAQFAHYGTLDPGAILKEYVLGHVADPADYVVIFTKHPPAPTS